MDNFKIRVPFKAPQKKEQDKKENVKQEEFVMKNKSASQLQSLNINQGKIQYEANCG